MGSGTLPAELTAAIAVVTSINPATADTAQCAEAFAALARLKSWTAATEARFDRPAGNSSG